MMNRELQEHVQDALAWEPRIDAAEISVSAEQGVVTLRGEVHTYAEKVTAERVTLKVYGVKAVANEIEVRIAGSVKRTDTEIAQAAVNALAWTSRFRRTRRPLLSIRAG